MTSYSFLPLRAEFVDNTWRALDRCVYRYVISLGGSTLLAELAAHCSLADGLGHSALSLADTVDHAAVRPLSDVEYAGLCSEPLVGDGTRPTAFVVHDGRFYLWRNFANERAVATALAARIGTTTAFSPVDPDLLAALFADSAPDQVAQQRLAVERVVQHRLLVLTGGPGTGKTTTVLRMLLALRASAHGGELAISIAAPTGKAAQRLAQSLREGAVQLRQSAGPAVRSLLDALPAFDASTLHRLLGYQATSQSWRSGKHRPLDADVVIVDEASMVDLNLLRVLLQSLRADTTLILVGDP
jgi:exodeoxyribonuclease V alpha subunit